MTANQAEDYLPQLRPSSLGPDEHDIHSGINSRELFFRGKTGKENAQRSRTTALPPTGNPIPGRLTQCKFVTIINGPPAAVL